MSRIGFAARLRHSLRRCDPAGDYSSVALVQLLLALLVTGGRRLRHLQYLAGDLIVLRFAGLAIVPTPRTVGRWLARCTRPVRLALQHFSADLVAEGIRTLGLKRLTVDVDGTVCSTGLQVERAQRGYNPHHRKVPSYYPVMAYIAQTGHVARVKNRPGNVPDGKDAVSFVRDVVTQIRDTIGNVPLEFRFDGAYFRRDLLDWLESRAEYAIKVPFWHWVGLRAVIQRRKRWRWIANDLQAFETRLPLEPWERIQRVVVYRRKVRHKSPKNYQLDLFDPSNGHWEYSAIATNKSIGMRALWKFMAGRGAHEKAIAELKSGLAFDTIPAQNYAANSAWQILVAMAHNLLVNFQIATRVARRHRTPKATAIIDLKSVRTLRFELFNRAGLLQHPAGRAVLTLSKNSPTRRIFSAILDKLAQAA
jgi:hypothetical protein